MKKSTKIILIGATALGIWGFVQDYTRLDARRLELVIEETGRKAVCTETKALEGNDWMTCRWGKGEADYGPVFIKVGERDGKPVWMSFNGKASHLVEKYLANTPQERQAKLATVELMPRPAPASMNLPGFVPWEQLN